jgi:hypothetical protein
MAARKKSGARKRARKPAGRKAARPKQAARGKKAARKKSGARKTARKKTARRAASPSRRKSARKAGAKRKASPARKKSARKSASKPAAPRAAAPAKAPAVQTPMHVVRPGEETRPFLTSVRFAAPVRRPELGRLNMHLAVRPRPFFVPPRRGPRR